MAGLKRVLFEIHRRSVWQVIAIYLVFTWLLFETFEVVRGAVGLPTWVEPTAAVILIVLLPAVLATASIQRGKPAPWPRVVIGGADEAPHPTEAAEGPGPEATSSAADRLARRPGPPPADVPRAAPRQLLTWRNTILGGAGAFLLLALFTTGYMILRAAGIGPAGTLVAQGTFDERERLILADFASPEDLRELARAITEGLRLDLAQSPVVRLYDHRYVSAALGRMELEPDAPLDLALAREVAQREAVRAVVGGEIRRVGSRYVMTAEVVTADDGAVLVSRRATAKNDDDIVGAVDELSKGLRERIGEPLRSIGRAVPLERVTTSNLEALRKYSSAVRAIDAEGAPDRGIALLEEAVALDPNFAMAWRKLGMAVGNRSEERGLVVEALTRAYEHRDRLTAREGDLAEAAYWSNVADDPDAAIAAYERLLERDPDERVALNNLGVLYFEQRDDETAASFFERALAVDSTETIPFVNLILTKANQGDHAAAIGLTDQYPWLMHDPMAKEHGAYAWAAAGDYEEAEARLRLLRDDEVASPFWQTQTSLNLAGLAALKGRLAEAERHYRDAMDANERRDLPRAYLLNALGLARIQLRVRGDAAGAIEIVEGALAAYPVEELPPLDRPSLELAELFAGAGRAARAAELLAVFEADVAPPVRGPGEKVMLDRVRGAVALAQGRTAEAIEATRAADRWTCVGCVLPQLGRAYEAAGRPDSAIAAYERYVAMPYLWRARDVDPWELAPALERLATLHEVGGDAERAAEQYARFVELWVEADEELQPRVRAAKARLEEIVRERP